MGGEPAMIVLGIRTDKPEAELYLYKDGEKLAEIKWQAYRQLSETIHRQIKKLLDLSSISLKDIEGLVCFQGPGSFTGLRIGLSVANALAYSQNIPIVATRGEEWLATGIKKLSGGKKDRIAVPFYGQLPKTTSPKK